MPETRPPSGVRGAGEGGLLGGHAGDVQFEDPPAGLSMRLPPSGEALGVRRPYRRLLCSRWTAKALRSLLAAALRSSIAFSARSIAATASARKTR